MSHNYVSPDDITFPEDLPESKKPIIVPPALKFVTSLLYGSGTTLSLVYVLLILIIQPLLEVQYERRIDFASAVLKRSRELLRSMNKTTNLPPVAIKRGEKFYSDAQVQTDEVSTRKSIVYFEDEVDSEGSNVLNDRLSKLKNKLQNYNQHHSTMDELSPLTFQIKKFQGRIDAYAQANLFRIRGRPMNETSTNQLKQEIRSIKGLFLTGQV